MSLDVAIKKRFRGFTLDVSFMSDAGPLGILGASGSGKSMTLKCIAGIETPDEGHIIVNGRVLFDSKKKIDLKPQKRKIGYLFQNYALFPNMTVAQNIACALGNKNRSEKAAIVADLLARFELSGLGGRYPSQLSGGQQQRVALARILAYEPDVLLLDEPFSALDAYLKESLQVDMIKLLKNYHGDAVMVTHNRDEVYKLCPGLMVLENGRVRSLGDTHDMFARPKDVATARLTGCKNISRAKKVSEYRVHALDWDVIFTVEEAVPDKTAYVGIRAHSFVPSRSADAQNAIAVKPFEVIEGPFEMSVLFQNAAGAGSATGHIWWKYAKQGGVQAMPDVLCVPPQAIFLLEE